MSFLIAFEPQIVPKRKMLNGIGNVYYPFVGMPPPLLPPPPAAPIWGPLLGIPFGQRIFLRTPWIFRFFPYKLV
ncbi:unnamed protein product [Gongylonema pulchrum]|uniref:Uncharacterized protein n=1 Tax=Gongylonema pulchrum TaxID=637853 RepID=A0A183EUJ2_9BILA|nr:unnamed protein product [Gongylonema pulchrum]